MRASNKNACLLSAQVMCRYGLVLPDFNNFCFPLCSLTMIRSAKSSRHLESRSSLHVSDLAALTIIIHVIHYDTEWQNSQVAVQGLPHPKHRLLKILPYC